MKKVAIMGASGMVGSHALQDLLDRSDVETVISFVRKAGNISHPKLQEVVLSDLLDEGVYAQYLKDITVAICCIGVYTGAADTETFIKVSTDIPVAFARALEKESPGARYCYLSGQGADKTEKSRMIFARTKGAAENQVGAMNLDFHTFRPGYIYPVVKRKEPNFSYKLARALYPIVKNLGSNLSIKSSELARIMVLVGLGDVEADEILENRDMRELLSAN